jgi:cell division protein FtsZ
MTYTGRAVMGMGVSRGANRAVEAAQKAVSSPLLEEGTVEGARGVLLNITGGPTLSLHEVDEASSIIKDAADPEANIIVGQVINPDMGDDLIVTVIATGFEREEIVKAVPDRARVATGRGGQTVMATVHVPIAELPTKQLDRPAFLRRPSGVREAQLGLPPEDEWDVPTFLRKQVD